MSQDLPTTEFARALVFNQKRELLLFLETNPARVEHIYGPKGTNYWYLPGGRVASKTGDQEIILDALHQQAYIDRRHVLLGDEVFVAEDVKKVEGVSALVKVRYYMVDANIPKIFPEPKQGHVIQRYNWFNFADLKRLKDKLLPVFLQDMPEVFDESFSGFPRKISAYFDPEVRLLMS